MKRELAIFLILLLLGIFALPLAVYFVGDFMFGDYGGAGYADFYGTLLGNLRTGDLAVWFLVLSPYLVWQLLRFSARGFRYLGNPRQPADS